MREFDGMVIMTIHDLNLAARYCDWIYLMKEGKICASGTPRDVLSERMMEEIFQVKIDILKRKEEIFIGV